MCGACRKVENKLLEMLNMRGRHKHKWDSLRQVLAEKVVYDDNNIRVWMAPDGSGQGLIYYAKQAQVRASVVTTTTTTLTHSLTHSLDGENSCSTHARQRDYAVLCCAEKQADDVVDSLHVGCCHPVASMCCCGLLRVGRPGQACCAGSEHDGCRWVPAAPGDGHQGQPGPSGDGPHTNSRGVLEAQQPHRMANPHTAYCKCINR